MTAADEIVPSLAETVADTLRLPYVAVEQSSEDGLATIVEHGRPVLDVQRLPLVHQGERLGTLIVGHRAPGERFDAADMRLLEQLAQQTTVAVRAVR